MEAEGILQWTFSTQNKIHLSDHWERTQKQKKGQKKNYNSDVLLKAFSYVSVTA
jgi:hypothetical protein